MARFLADENVPAMAVEAARSVGVDVIWVGDIIPKAGDEDVLALARAEVRVLVTLDKDFGDLTFRRGLRAAPGVVLARPRLASPGAVARFLTTLLSGPGPFEGVFRVAREGSDRAVPMPAEEEFPP